MTTFSDGNVLTAAQLNSITQGTGIEDGAITAAKLSAESWTAFVPTWNNVTLGTGSTSSGRYIVYGKTVFLTAILLLGTGGSASSTITMSLPASQTTANQVVGYDGSGRMTDDNTGTFYTMTASLNPNDSTISFFVHNDSSQVDNNTPFTWADSDQLRFSIVYELA